MIQRTRQLLHVFSKLSRVHPLQVTAGESSDTQRNPYWKLQADRTGRTQGMLELMPGLTTKTKLGWVINTTDVKHEHGALLKAYRCLQKTPVSGVTVNAQNLQESIRLSQERYSCYVS